MVITDLVGDETDVNRLREMGIREGAKIHIFRNGKTFVISVNNTKLSIRCNVEIHYDF